MPEFYNVKATAAYFGKSRATIQAWRRNGDLPDKRFWTLEELKAVKNKPKKGAPSKRKKQGGEAGAPPENAGRSEATPTSGEESSPAPPPASKADKEPPRPERPLADVDPRDPYKLNLPIPPKSKGAEPGRAPDPNASKPAEADEGKGEQNEPKPANPDQKNAGEKGSDFWWK